ncbi:hypothetical protein P1P75_27500 [Streptomyces sp. ID05-39B]|uniref:hypothetical protein n=1 Tax=Streptomyces sp. ID05-39B TaxID=3028664 RepID=UPI0029A43213|nr:hypothetical protein [Streptomyces sp. ID05-39B]MDX3530057.1 hypothetical protein [Streptomyces sp. ID05-39B]
MLRVGEAGDVADLGGEHGGQDRADPADGLDRLVAGVVGEPGGDLPIEPGELRVKRAPYRAQRQVVEEGGAAVPNRSLMGTAMPA